MTQWVHLAVVRHEHNIGLYINGTLDANFATTTFTTELNRSSDPVYLASARTGSGDTQGYYDEFRISGVARYTANFTPSTTAFKDDKDTKLLLHFDGGGNIVDGVAEAPGQGQYFFDSATNAIFYDDNGIPTYKSFMYFDGSSDYLQMPASSDWNFGTGDLTIECWVNFVTLPDQMNGFWTSANDAAPTTYNEQFAIWDMGAKPKVGVLTNAGGWKSSATSPTIGSGQWYYITWCRSSGKMRIFVNGISVYEFDSPESITFTEAQIGRGAYLGNTWTNANIDQFRVSNIARYSPPSFTPAVAEFSNDANTKLLLHCDGTNGGTTFTDSSGSSHTVTANGGANTSTAQKKFGTASAYFDGTGDFLQSADSPDWDLSGDFTWEMWIRPATINTGGDAHYLMTQHEDSNNRVQWFQNTANVAVYDV